jgi:8-oxo-dGTP pyrophosphatase MutT (NUDIX family)
MGYIEELRNLVGTRPLILVGSVVVIVNGAGRILLQQRRFPKGSWGLPGGLMELGESTEATARREVLEETSLKLGNLKLINVYSGVQNYIKAENGDEFYVVTTAYYSEDIEGEIKADKVETIQLDFFYPEELPAEIVKSHKLILEEYLSGPYRAR